MYAISSREINVVRRKTRKICGPNINSQKFLNESIILTLLFVPLIPTAGYV